MVPYLSPPPQPPPATEDTDYATEAEFIEAQRKKTVALLDQRLSKTGQFFFQGARKAFALGVKALAIGCGCFLLLIILAAVASSFESRSRSPLLELLLAFSLLLIGLSSLIMVFGAVVYGCIVLTRFAQFSLSSLLWAVLSLGLLGWMFTSQNELLIPLGVFLAVQFVIVLLCWIYNSDPYVKQSVALDEFRRKKRARL